MKIRRPKVSGGCTGTDDEFLGPGSVLSWSGNWYNVPILFLPDAAQTLYPLLSSEGLELLNMELLSGYLNPYVRISVRTKDNFQCDVVVTEALEDVFHTIGVQVFKGSTRIEQRVAASRLPVARRSLVEPTMTGSGFDLGAWVSNWFDPLQPNSKQPGTPTGTNYQLPAPSVEQASFLDKLAASFGLSPTVLVGVVGALILIAVARD